MLNAKKSLESKKSSDKKKHFKPFSHMKIWKHTQIIRLATELFEHSSSPCCLRHKYFQISTVWRIL